MDEKTFKWTKNNIQKVKKKIKLIKKYINERKIIQMNIFFFN